MDKRFVVAVVGGLAVDLITVTDRLPDPGETVLSTSFSQQFGGKGANSAIAAHRTSRNNPVRLRTDSQVNGDTHAQDHVHIEVRFTGAVGNDSFGDQYLKELPRYGIDTRWIRRVDGATTGVCVIIVESDTGENRPLLTTGANLCLPREDFLTAESLGGGVRPDLVISQLEILRETTEQILRTTRENGIPMLLNPAPAQYLLMDLYRDLTHLIVNETEAAILTGRDINSMNIEDLVEWAKITDEFLDRGVKNVIVTLGAKGAYYSNRVGNGGHVEAEKDLVVVDTTGAGDTFIGTYGAEYVRQKSQGRWDIREAVQKSCKASSRIICQVGCQAAIPWADEIDLSPPVLPLQSLVLAETKEEDF